MKTSEAFRKTLKYLWNGVGRPNPFKGKEEYICHAAAAAEVYEIVGPIINKLLGSSTSYVTWVSRKTGLTHREIYLDMVKLQYSRKMWIEHLIKHYESIGD